MFEVLKIFGSAKSWLALTWTTVQICASFYEKIKKLLRQTYKKIHHFIYKRQCALHFWLSLQIWWILCSWAIQTYILALPICTDLTCTDFGKYRSDILASYQANSRVKSIICLLLLFSSKCQFSSNCIKWLSHFYIVKPNHS